MRFYRTIAVAALGLLVLLAGLFLSVRWNMGGVVVFGSFAAAVVGIVMAVAGKAGVDSLAGGDGVKGALKNLMTDKKPGDPPPDPAITQPFPK